MSLLKNCSNESFMDKETLVSFANNCWKGNRKNGFVLTCSMTTLIFIWAWVKIQQTKIWRRPSKANRKNKNVGGLKKFDKGTLKWVQINSGQAIAISLPHNFSLNVPSPLGFKALRLFAHKLVNQDWVIFFWKNQLETGFLIPYLYKMAVLFPTKI